MKGFVFRVLFFSRGLGFGVWGLGFVSCFRVWGLGFGVWGLGFVWGMATSRAFSPGIEFQKQSLGLRFRVSGHSFEVLGQVKGLKGFGLNSEFSGSNLGQRCSG